MGINIIASNDEAIYDRMPVFIPHLIIGMASKYVARAIKNILLLFNIVPAYRLIIIKETVIPDMLIFFDFNMLAS
ncbi:hypothetical protein FDN13_13355 [Caloramator sp. E03]|uniref:hypothetical protein n=1 Tax=Caloramator sp. E03 TaxID=2576307 RepID=UPI0011105B98|nr:hypothetical protein [Caloramator sp. E03]QCX34609.1 hypothetical protein FDN13_13355 [Caloramator sp. E03]